MVNKRNDKRRIKLFSNLIDWIFIMKNNNVYSNKKREYSENKITNLLLDYNIKKDKASYYSCSEYKGRYSFRLIEDPIKLKMVTELYYDKKDHKRLKNKFK